MTDPICTQSVERCPPHRRPLRRILGAPLQKTAPDPLECLCPESRVRQGRHGMSLRYFSPKIAACFEQSSPASRQVVQRFGESRQREAVQPISCHQTDVRHLLRPQEFHPSVLNQLPGSLASYL